MQDHPTTLSCGGGLAPPSLSRLAPPPPLETIVTPSIKKGKTIMKDQRGKSTEA
jgi:hypothetical protein